MDNIWEGLKDRKTDKDNHWKGIKIGRRTRSATGKEIRNTR